MTARQAIRGELVESEEPDSSMAPWAVNLLSATRDGVPCYECDSARESDPDPGDATPGLGVVVMERPAIRSDRGYEFLVGDRFVEAVDRVIEQWNASTILLGKPAVAPFGEMVARRGVKPLGVRFATPRG